MIRWTSLLFLLGLLAAGCEPPPPAEAQQTRAVGAAPQPTADPNEAQRLQDLRAKYTEAKAAHEKAKGDKQAQASFVSAAVELGTAVMWADSLAPREKYPEALKLYREALALDPANKEAIESKDTIEKIYASMGRPVPE